MRSAIAFSAASLSLAALAAVVACVEVNSPPTAAPTAPPSQVASTSTPPPPAPTGSGDASAPDATVTGTGPGATDGVKGAPAQFRSCARDADCVAADRVGCCNNGWKEAVAASQKDAYAKSFTCPQKHPICPLYVVQDNRVSVCDNATLLCTMVNPQDVPCGGASPNAHTCPAGYTCQGAKPGSSDAGKCVKQ
jgi:hypothetical protein